MTSTASDWRRRSERSTTRSQSTTTTHRVRLGQRSPSTPFSDDVADTDDAVVIVGCWRPEDHGLRVGNMVRVVLRQLERLLDRGATDLHHHHAHAGVVIVEQLRFRALGCIGVECHGPTWPSCAAARGLLGRRWPCRPPPASAWAGWSGGRQRAPHHPRSVPGRLPVGGRPSRCAHAEPRPTGGSGRAVRPPLQPGGTVRTGPGQPVHRHVPDEPPRGRQRDPARRPVRQRRPRRARAPGTTRRSSATPTRLSTHASPPARTTCD